MNIEINQIINKDALTGLKELPDDCVNCCITSPPYFHLRDYEVDGQTGCIIGSVEIVDCVQNHPSIWAEKGVYNWVLANPVLFNKPIENVKGKLSFWDFDLKEEAIKLISIVLDKKRG